METREISDDSVLLDRADDPISHSRRHGCAKHRVARRGVRPGTYRLVDEAAEIGHDIAVDCRSVSR